MKSKAYKYKVGDQVSSYKYRNPAPIILKVKSFFRQKDQNGIFWKYYWLSDNYGNEFMEAEEDLNEVIRIRPEFRNEGESGWAEVIEDLGDRLDIRMLDPIIWENLSWIPFEKVDKYIIEFVNR